MPQEKKDLASAKKELAKELLEMHKSETPLDDKTKQFIEQELSVPKGVSVELNPSDVQRCAVKLLQDDWLVGNSDSNKCNDAEAAYLCAVYGKKETQELYLEKALYRSYAPACPTQSNKTP